MTPAEKLAEKHNAEVRDKKAAPSNSGVPTNLKDYVGRLDTLEDEKFEIVESIKELKVEAKSVGIDPKVLTAIVKRKREDSDKKAKRAEFEEKFDAYAFALGMLD